MALRSIVVAAALAAVSSAAIAAEQPKPGFLAGASCTVVRYYVAKYTAAGAESWARSNGATAAEIEKARRCLRIETAQGLS